MYVIKHVPEDFVVSEILDLDAIKSENGNYSLFNLKKRTIDTFSLISKISKKLSIEKKHIGYCGIKDKKAITEQHISIPIKYKNKATSLDFSNLGFELNHISEISSKLNIGDNIGNEFSIVVRNLDNEDFPVLKSNKFLVPNYYGDQRFSTMNIEIGRNLVKKDFKSAIELIERDSEFSGIVSEFLQINKNDFIGALSKIPKERLIFYIHSYQSYMWNEAVEILLSDDDWPSQQKIPTLGFSTMLFGEIRDAYSGIISKEKINMRDFIIRELPFLSMDGTERDLYMDVKNFKYFFDKDEFFENKKKCKLEFELGKGSYATELIKYIFKKSSS